MIEVDIAIVADIHGNRWALEAVLEDIERQGAAQIVDLGDSLLGPFDPAGTADLLAARGIPSVRGNCDRIILAEAGADDSPTKRLAVRVLTARQRAWLAALPATRVLGDGILLCHGTPQADDCFLLEQATMDGPVLRPAAEIADDLNDVRQAVICCAHSHIPRLVAVPTGQVIVNPGSAGVPAYFEELPWPHKMETGSPHARYATLSDGPHGWHVSFHAVHYDWERAARSAAEVMGPAYADWVRTGRA
ncbi:MAG TPA: metallophosphoesterase family protein [Thermomicrobiaceae bacterium]|nr:metallophosphoesterase family protein [Thermomicrobiaceae bacterium]